MTLGRLLLATLASFNVGDEGAQGRAGDTTLTWGTDWGTAGGREEDDEPEETLPTPSGEQLNLVCLEFPVDKFKNKGVFLVVLKWWLFSLDLKI